MEKIHLNVSKPYDVIVSNESFDTKQLLELLAPFCHGFNVAVVTDDIVDSLYASRISETLIKNGYSTFKYVFPNGEQSKNIDTLSSILDFLAENGFKRNDILIAVGGGVVGDITGLASALYMRGIRFIQIPTTLLAMVDASVGGKTAVDIKAGKNLIGAFWQPSLVICNTDIVRNLPPDIFKEGMAEVLKCDVIANLGIFNHVIDDSLLNNLDYIIYQCIELKKEIVEKDEFETKGIRNLLNVGHTFAHGLEKLSNYRISHGYAVGTGLVWEAAIAYKKNLCSFETFELIKKAVFKCDLLLDFDYSFGSLAEAMKKDKKNKNNRITFMLPKEIGNCVEVQIESNELIDLLSEVGILI